MNRRCFSSVRNMPPHIDSDSYIRGKIHVCANSQPKMYPKLRELGEGGLQFNCLACRHNRIIVEFPIYFIFIAAAFS